MIGGTRGEESLQEFSLMPIYEYTCEKCGQDFEHLAKSMAASSARVECPQCGSAKTLRRMSVCSVKGETTIAAAPARAHAPSCACCRPGGGCPMQQ
jgi:putative FmdB family regulatory protein